MINMNKLAQEVSAMEGLKVEVSIAQIKEVIKCTLVILTEEKPSDVLALIEKISGNY
jgi:hypothetical protein